MARLKWDNEGDRLYETGIKEVVLYVWGKVIDTEESYDLVETEPADFGTATDKYYKKVGNEFVLKGESDTWAPDTYYTHTAEESHEGYTTGVAWNGITAVNETPTGAEATDLYADDQKYLSLLSAEELEATVEAYTYPDEWGQCDGSASPVPGIKFGQQARKQFCLSYITTVGNDTDGNDYGEKLHILYNCKASPSERSYATINDSPEAITFSWSLKATKASIDQEQYKDYGLKNTALITLDSKDFNRTDNANLYDTIKDKLQGSSEETPSVLMPNDILQLIAAEG